MSLVRLEDGRGCWTVRERSTLKWASDKTSCKLPGATWKHLPFALVGDLTAAVPVYRTTRPAIGPARTAFIPSLYLPDLWNPPA